MKNKILQIILSVFCFIFSTALLLTSVTLFAHNINNSPYRGNYNFTLGENYYLVLDENISRVYSTDEDVCSLIHVPDDSTIDTYNFVYIAPKSTKNKKFYYLDIKQIGTCYLNVERSGLFNGESKISDIFDITIKFDYSTIDYVDISDGVNTTRVVTSSISKNEEYLTNKKETFEFEFGKKYTLYYNEMILGEYNNSVISETTASCILSDGSVSKEMDLNSQGELIVWGNKNGSFRYFTDNYGGFEFDYTIKFSNTRLLNCLYAMYNEIYGNTINSPEQLSFDFYRDIKQFKLSFIPNFLSDELFSEYFTGVEEIILYNLANNTTKIDCLIPNNIHKVTLENRVTESKFINVMFYGDFNKTDCEFNINGPFKLYSENSGVFVNFNNLTIKTNTISTETVSAYDLYFGVLAVQQTYIYVLKCGNASAVAGIKETLNLEINHPTVIAGSDGVGAKHDVRNDYLPQNSNEKVSCPSSDNPTRGYRGIETNNLLVTANSHFACLGGIGGTHSNPKFVAEYWSSGDGCDGVYGGDGCNGAEAIVANSVTFSNSEGKIYILGGDGGWAGSGTKGTDGKNITGVDTNGGSGGDGGNGGNGALPIHTYSITNESNNLNLHFGEGGLYGLGGGAGYGRDAIFDKGSPRDGVAGSDGIRGASATEDLVKEVLSGKEYNLIKYWPR